MVRELLGLAFYREGRYREALAELLAFRRITGSLEQNHVIADCYRALGRPERALEICGEVTADRVPPEVWAEVLIVAASTLADRGELDGALATLARADLDPEEVKPHHLRLWYVRSDLLERAGFTSEARAGWERILAEDPDFFDAAERLASR
jgi:tetratricopeptide (TPR) repeat protein